MTAPADVDFRLLRRLIEVWFLNFDGENRSVRQTGRRLAKALPSAPGGRFDHWRRLDRTCGLFEAGTGPSALAAAILRDPAVLTANALDQGMRPTSGYLRAAQIAMVKVLPDVGREMGDQALDNAMAFFAPAGALRFNEPGSNGQMADALVAPWHGGQWTPDTKARAKILAFLRQHIGDPRVDRQKWRGASERTQQTVRGWLAQLSLEAFFQRIGQFAANAGQDHQWQSRKAFWSACLRLGLIEDGWLALGDNVWRSIQGERDLVQSVGRLATNDANHSVLLMRVGRLVFAEWSHMGKVRAWLAGSDRAPRLFERRYDRTELVLDGLRFPPPMTRPDLDISGNQGIAHIPDQIWQGRVAALIRQETQRRIGPDDWNAR